MRYTPHNYQLHATEHILENPAAGLFLDMGLGKTVSTLTALVELLFDRFESEKILVIAPKRVALSTWTDEVAKWDHLKGLKLSRVLGDEKKRKQALKEKAHIYVINRENVAWLVGQYSMRWPFDTVVIDELSSFKSPKSGRFKALRKVRPLMRRVIGLTGTPSPNGLEDLWSQIYLLDQGERLGKTVTGFRERYLKPDKMMGHIVTKYKEKKGAPEAIQAAISDICVSMKAADYLELPELITLTNPVDISDHLADYEAFETEQILRLFGDGQEITAVNAPALVNKLLQFCNGAVYDGEKNMRHVHDEKLEALEEIIEAASGDPVLVFYQFRHDLDRIVDRLKAVELKSEETLRAWNAKQIPVLVAHAASAGHGLNMQHGGNVLVWFGLPWSLELYQQAIARLHRQGQTKPVRNIRLVCPGTVEDDVIDALEKKTRTQDELLIGLKAKISKVLSRQNRDIKFRH